MIFAQIPGRISNFSYELKLKDENTFFRKTYPVPIKFREKVQFAINKMLENNIIEKLDSDCINPIIVVIKKNGDVRICLDARQLNSKLIMDHEAQVSYALKFFW